MKKMHPCQNDILGEQQYRSCRLCPRQCGADRAAHQPGYCRCTDQVTVARAALHFWEEPCISGANSSGGSDTSCPSSSATSRSCGASSGGSNATISSGVSSDGSDTSCPSNSEAVRSNGSGAVFFSGCTLGCCFCQNYSISHGHFGKEITVRQLADIFLRLQDEGACNINLVTATQYLPSVVQALDLVQGRLTIPVVYNCGGYERPEIVRALADYIDIWLPDLKYFDPSLAARYSQAGDYFSYASQAILQMIDQTGAPVMDENGLLRSGVIIRHMVLPGARADSIRLLHWMKDNLPEGKWLLSLMSQYTPAGEAAAPPVCPNTFSSGDSSSFDESGFPGRSGFSGNSRFSGDSSSSDESGFPANSVSRFPELARRITTFEYESVLNTAIDLGLTAGYMQQKSSAKEEYTPPFDLTGV